MESSWSEHHFLIFGLCVASFWYIISQCLLAWVMLSTADGFPPVFVCLSLVHMLQRQHQLVVLCRLVFQIRQSSLGAGVLSH